MTSEVAQGKTRIERAILRPWNFWLSTIAMMKPSSVEMPTTDSTHHMVLSMTVLNAGSFTAST